MMCRLLREVIGVATLNPFATFLRCVGMALRAFAHPTLGLGELRFAPQSGSRLRGAGYLVVRP